MQFQVENLLVKFVSPITSNRNRQSEDSSLWFDNEVSYCEWVPFECGYVFALKENELAGLKGQVFIDFECQHDCILVGQIHRDEFYSSEEPFEVAEDMIEEVYRESDGRPDPKLKWEPEKYVKTQRQSKRPKVRFSFRL